MICLVWVTPSKATQEKEFSTFLENLRTDMQQEGVEISTLDKAFKPLEAPLVRVVELDRNQPEYKQTLKQYLDARVTQNRIEMGQKLMREHRPLLEEVAEKYKVQPRFIVALWGMETNYGRFMGSFEIIPSLVTLVYDGRREKFFKKELVHALKILEEGHIELENFKGSWAGAMGQCQFMPSSFRNYAVDYDGDGKKDIWSTKADVFASAANYLSGYGWKVDETWGREVMLPDDFDRTLAAKKVKKPLPEWAKLGVKNVDGSPLPSRAVVGRVLIPDNNEGRVFMAYSNVDTTLRWNKADYFAIAVGTLADEIGTSYTHPESRL